MRTGAFLSAAFKEGGYETGKVRIKSSPFLRCVMTAVGIAEGMAVPSKIYIDSTYCEVLSPKLFSEFGGNPIPRLEIFNNINYLNKLGFKNVEIILHEDPFADEINQLYPETDVQCSYRTMRTTT